jgi:DNA invertase Pin-like site-specific DNA recombinase
MVAKLDRLSRSLVDFAGITAEAHAGGWNLVALDLGVDLSTPAGEFLANVMASAAQWERRIIGQRTSDALRARAAAGVTLGRPTRLSPTTAALIAAARTRGDSYARIAADLQTRGIPTPQGGTEWRASSVRSIHIRHDVGAGSKGEILNG